MQYIAVVAFFTHSHSLIVTIVFLFNELSRSYTGLDYKLCAQLAPPVPSPLCLELI